MLAACLAAAPLADAASADAQPAEDETMAKPESAGLPQPDRNAPEVKAPSASRPAPRKVEPIVIGAVRYESVWGSLGEFRAVDAKSGKELWALTLHRLSYVKGLETDVQDRFVVAMAKESETSIRLEDEAGRSYRVDLAKRAARIAVWPVSLRDAGRPLAVEVILQNGLDRTVLFDKPSVASGGRLENDLFEVKADGKPVPYGGMMAKRGAPGSFLELKPLGEYRQVVDLSGSYSIPQGTKVVEVRFRHRNHFSPDDFDLESRPLRIVLDDPSRISAPKY